MPQKWKHSSTICHVVIHDALDGAPEHLQFIDDIIVLGETDEEVFKKSDKIIDILSRNDFAIEQDKVKASA